MERAGEGESMSAWRQAAAEGRLDEAVVEYVRWKDWVTFPELLRDLEPFFGVRGKHCITFEDPNLIAWAGMSEQFVVVMLCLLRTGGLHAHPSCLLTHIVDGAIPKLPIAKRPPKNGYQEPHWVPVCLRVHPFANGKSKRG